MSKRILLPVLSALAVSACATTTPDSGGTTTLPGFDNTGDPCGAVAREYLIGQPVSEVDLESLARLVRPIHPGQPVTMDYRGERLNLDLDGDGVIVRLWCG
ncbi:I78 family peptidase inhibitor [Maricaulis sp.]|uniref:I78 family peptidase inhibitor n=1 Tax=Maricaulis sp. TaxID=1486257 RepID=UPI003A8F06E5